METENRTSASVLDLNSSCWFADSFSSNEVAIQVSALGVILTLSLVGNVLLIYVVLRNKCLKKSSCNDVFLLNMAISDMLIPLVILPREITVYYTQKDAWPFDHVWGDFTCKIYTYLENVSPSVTVLTLICMTIDRFCAIVFPTKIKLISDKIRKGMIFSTWIIGSATSSTYLFTMGIEKDGQGNKECILEWPRGGSYKDSNNIFMMFSLLFYFLIPLVLMIILYSLILSKLKTKSHVHSSEMASKRMRIAKRVTFMTVCVVGIFLLFFGPYYSLLTFLAFYWKWNYPPLCSWPTIILTVRFLVFSHAGVNPFICICLIENHRRKVTRALTRAARSITSSHLGIKNMLGSANSCSLRNITESRSAASNIRIDGIRI